MYYTATERSTGDQCIGMATATTPFGPYQRHRIPTGGVRQRLRRLAHRRRWVLRRQHRPRHLHRSGTGNSYLLWKSDGNHVGETYHQDPGRRRCRRTCRPITLSGLANALLSAQESWQSGIVEGPDMYDNQSRRSGSNTTNNYVPLLRRQRRRCEHVQHRMGLLPGPAGPVHRHPAGWREPTPDHPARGVGAGWARTCTPCRRRKEPPARP